MSSCCVNFARTVFRITETLTDSQSRRSFFLRSRPIRAAIIGDFVVPNAFLMLGILELLGLEIMLGRWPALPVQFDRIRGEVGETAIFIR